MFEALRSRWALFGAVAIGLYVGAEVSIGSIMINFLNQRQVLGLPFEEAGGYLANFYWGGALCGRLVGTLLLTRIRAARLLAACGMVAALLCLIVLAGHGPDRSAMRRWRSAFSIRSCSRRSSRITLERSGVSQSATSGLLCVAIFGGALLPLAVGAIADRFGLERRIRVPLVGYAFIALFALAARDRRARTSASPIQSEPIDAMIVLPFLGAGGLVAIHGDQLDL